MKVYKKILSYILFSVVICSASFSGSLLDIFTKNKEVIIPIQDKYDELQDNVPAYIILKPNSSSMLSQETLNYFQDSLCREMIESQKFKPVVMDKWLTEQYGERKANSTYSFINNLTGQRYNCSVKGACHLYVYKITEGYFFNLSFYDFSNGVYPISTFRKIENKSDCTKAFSAMIEEYNKIITEKTNKLYEKKKIIVKPFTLESRKYIGQDEGEFDYIPATFIEQDGIVIRSTDDSFSRLLSYSLYTSQMVDSISLLDLERYVNLEKDLYDYADFYIEGRIQLTDQINIYHISLFDAKTKKEIQSVKYFSSDFSLEGNLIANNNIILSLADSIFGKDNYGVCPDIKVPGQGLYLNNIYLGSDSLEQFVLPRGKHIIYTGDYFKPDSSMQVKNKDKAVDINGNVYRSFFLYLNERNWLFRGKDGERVWNLLEK